MTSAAEYVGRTSDLLAFQANYEARLKPQELIQALVNDKGASFIVTGIQKLAQRFLLALLTELGSIPFLNRGSRFMTDGQRGRWRTTADVQQSFYSARLDVARQLRQDERSIDPADERYADAVLRQVTLTGTTVSITVLLTSQAGTSYLFVAPLPVAIR